MNHQIILGAYHPIQGWLLKLEKGGIRRVLMNVFGNSLKFTTVCLFFLLGAPFRSADKIWQDGYVHVIIRQLPSTPDVPPNKVKLELVVVDTGKVRTDSHINGASSMERQ